MLLQEMTWPEISNLSRDIPVLVPVAALEQHGHHMPVFTDSLLVGEVVRRVGVAMTDPVLIAPLMWLGNSHHHMDFPGTLSASPRVYLTYSPIAASIGGQRSFQGVAASYAAEARSTN